MRSHAGTGSAASSMTVALKSVESRCGAVTVGRTYLFPPLSFGGASLIRPWPRLHTPLVKPDVRISRIRLSPVPSDLRSRQVDTSRWNAVEAECLVKILVWDLAKPDASSFRAAHQPAADPSFSVCSNELIDFYDWPLVKVAAPAA
jgi:hypothetical protein